MKFLRKTTCDECGGPTYLAVFLGNRRQGVEPAYCEKCLEKALVFLRRCGEMFQTGWNFPDDEGRGFPAGAESFRPLILAPGQTAERLIVE